MVNMDVVRIYFRIAYCVLRFAFVFRTTYYARRTTILVAAALLVCSNCWAVRNSTEVPKPAEETISNGASEIERSDSWDIEDATLRFRIEKDHSYAQLPDVHVSDLQATKGPSDLKESRTKGQWAGTYYRVNEQVYKKAIAVSSAATVVYKNQKEYGRFVALAGVDDRADPNASVSFEVYADERRLYKSRPLTKQMPPVEINVRIPSGSKELKLVTTGSNMQGRRANWVNAGFLLKGKNPNVSYVKIYTPGYDPSDFEAVVFTSNGKRVNSQLLWAGHGEPMEILFNSGSGSVIYFVYMVRKGPMADKYKSAAPAWEPKAGLVLETRRTDKIYPQCDKLPELLRVWNEVAEPIGKSVVGNIHHGFPIHRLAEFAPPSAGRQPAEKGGMALYYYKGFFEIEKAGQYTFATASNWGSYLLIDDKEVVSWTGEHDYRAGIRGSKQGQLRLEPGVHKLEYRNYIPWGEMFTLAAWQSPQGKLNLMTRGDFSPVGRCSVTSIGYNELTKDGGSFEWRIVDDWQLEQGPGSPASAQSVLGGAAMVQMRFDVVRASGTDEYSYRWKFDDGKIETGGSVEHVFLRTGMCPVTFEVLKDQKVVAGVTQKVRVHPLWDKVHPEPENIETFEKAISESDFRTAPIGALVSLYAFADGLERPQLKQQVVAALMKRVDELVAERQSEDGYDPAQLRWAHFCFELGRHLCSAPVRQYEQALTLFTRLREESTEDRRVRQQAMVSQAELLVRCFGKIQEAIEILNRLEKESDLDEQLAHRFGMIRAETLIAAGEVNRAREMLGPQGSEQRNKTSEEVKHIGMLRHARLLAEAKDDPVQLDYAMEEIETILAEDPLKMLMPSLNLVRLDVHLARQEHLIAFHLAQRLSKLELSNYYQLEVLVRQVRALCGIKAVEQAKAIYETMVENYPYSPVVAEAKKAIVEVVMAGQEK
jgi:tetratricopeptide (TPR) repeat protein